MESKPSNKIFMLVFLLILIFIVSLLIIYLQLNSIDRDIVMINNKVDRLNNTIIDYDDSLSLINKEMSDVNKRIDNIQQEINTLKSRINNIPYQLEDIDIDDNENLPIHVNDLQKTLTEVKSNGYKAEQFFYMNNSFDIFIARIPDVNIGQFWKDDNGDYFGSIQNVKEYLINKGHEVMMITNSGIYKENREPLGLYIEKGEERIPLNIATNKDEGINPGNFYLKPNGVFVITNNNKANILTTEAYADIHGFMDPKLALQSGPMLLINGEIHPDFTEGSQNKNIRSGIGIINENIIAFAISNEPASFYDFAMFFKEELECSSALYLDGVISKTYIPSLNRDETNGDFAGLIAVYK